MAGIFGANDGQGLILQGLSGSNATQVFAVDADGNLDISGNLTVSGSKSARVKLQDGRDVALEPGFLQTVNTATDYHVFLTPNGDCHGLYVERKTSAGCEVREIGRGTASITFDYRIVARRRGFEQVRLEEVHVPQGPKDLPARLVNMRSHEHVTPPAAPQIHVPQPPNITIPPCRILRGPSTNEIWGLPGFCRSATRGVGTGRSTFFVF